MQNNDSNQFESLPTELITWAALLAHWTDFAKRAVGLPQDAAGQRMRAAVPHVIGLQAVWFSLQQINDLPEGERRLGLDRSAVLIDRYVAGLAEAYGDEPFPDGLQELINDSKQALLQVESQ